MMYDIKSGKEFLYFDGHEDTIIGAHFSNVCCLQRLLGDDARNVMHSPHSFFAVGWQAFGDCLKRQHAHFVVCRASVFWGFSLETAHNGPLCSGTQLLGNKYLFSNTSELLFVAVFLEMENILCQVCFHSFLAPS